MRVVCASSAGPGGRIFVRAHASPAIRSIAAMRNTTWLPRRRHGRRGGAGSTGGPARANPVTAQEREVDARLRDLGIAFTRHEHPSVATVEEAERHWVRIDATHCKNLFLRNQKGTRHYLVILIATKKADLRAVAEQIGDGKLSFGSPARLMTHLGLTPGSVSPFGLIHDRDGSVRVVLDRDLKSAARVSFHPNINTVTLTISFADFEKFLDVVGNAVQYVTV